MKYRVKDGVVLLSICDSYFLFPSRDSGVSVPFLITADEKLVSILKGNSAGFIAEETSKKLNRLTKLGYIEEAE